MKRVKFKSILRWTATLLLMLVGLVAGIAFRDWALPGIEKEFELIEGALVEGAGGTRGADSRQPTTASGGRKIAYYKGPMNPNFISLRPGMSPMGMALVPVYEDEIQNERLIALEPAVIRNIGLRTVPVATGKSVRTIHTVGTVEVAEPRLADVTLKIDGWVEKVLVDFIGQQVSKGQTLFTFYSPDLVVAQEEYLLSLNPSARTGFGGSFLPAYAKLRYWDVPPAEIESIRQLGHSKRAIAFTSPIDGWVMEKHTFSGMAMTRGERFYRIADLSTVWVYVMIYGYQLPLVELGQQASLSFPYRPGEEYRGKVVYIYPDVDRKTRQIKVRLEFANPDLQLKPQMYGNVVLQSQRAQSALLVPLDAVLYTGRKKTIDGKPQPVGIAFVEMKPGEFDPREVVVGSEVEGGMREVRGGLKEGESVVVTGQFVLETERALKESTRKLVATLRAAASGPVQETVRQGKNGDP